MDIGETLVSSLVTLSKTEFLLAFDDIRLTFQKNYGGTGKTG